LISTFRGNKLLKDTSNILPQVEVIGYKSVTKVTVCGGLSIVEAEEHSALPSDVREVAVPNNEFQPHTSDTSPNNLLDIDI